MGLSWTSYYQLARVTETGPEVKNWAVTDTNWQVTSLLFKRFEQHRHNASTPMRYPGYNVLNPATPATPLITQASTGGSIAAGTNIGIRMSFVDQYGLETEAAPEQTIQMPSVVLRPNAPVISAPVSTPVPGGLPGGTFVYALTKRLNTGESALSDVTTIDVPFDNNATSSYIVPLQFDPINSYTDGTDSLCLYRTTGFDSNFVLLTTFTATPGLQNAVNTYTDTGAVQDATHQPPQASEFGKQNLITINWANINIPATAYRFRIYLTQQTGVWGNSNLFQDYQLISPATPFPTSVTYLGTEILDTGYPLDFTQIPFGSSLINLSTDAIGGPIYTQPGNAQGWQTWNFVFPTNVSNATPMFGAAYVDGTVGGNGQLKVCLATPSGPNNPGIFTTLAGVGSGYAHPLAESGGHVASHIYAAPTGIGGPTQDQINNIISTPVAGGPGRYRIPATSIYKVTATPADLQNSTVGTWINMPDMNTNGIAPSGISPDFTGQWIECEFQTWTTTTAATASGQIISAILAINGVQMNETYTSLGGTHVSSGQVAYGQLNFTFATPLTRPNNVFTVQWLLSQPGSALSYGGNIPGQLPRRYFMIKELF